MYCLLRHQHSNVPPALVDPGNWLSEFDTDLVIYRNPWAAYCFITCRPDQLWPMVRFPLLIDFLLVAFAHWCIAYSAAEPRAWFMHRHVAR
jgi:hypothetical protein